jgi:valyl-tRNA synthetase
MKQEFPKSFEPHQCEGKWFDKWRDNQIYKSKIEEGKENYSILMPPPNVTGILHFGHVLNQTLQDIYIRRNRMQGKNVCWFPGMDHAGIATQSKVEAALKEDGITRYDLGREKFIDKVWEWKEKYGGIILTQLQKLGISCDWDKSLFTMDESASTAVSEVFIRLFDEGLIYKGKKIINWSPLARTALSDEEVEFKEVDEQLYTLRYYFEDSDEYLQVATVRTETIFGDVAVAVNPKDERFGHLIGKKVRVPLVDRLVPIIPDEHADPEFGTGCVKITPAHDPNDFMVGERHNLEIINTINPDATLNENAGEYNGMDRFEARKAISKKLKELDLIEKVEAYTHSVGISQRGGEPVEPYLCDQWFVDMKPLAQDALEVVKAGKINFHPAHWVKTYEHWMTNIRDWCISRQLWWGHRIPVYYTEDGKYVAAQNEEKALEKLGLPAGTKLTQDPDVLDTWFSSWLWPMTTMNWMHDGVTEETEDMKAYLPTDLLVTAPDIIFFWVARMIMATTKFKQEIPFKDVYFTSTIRDGQGRKLSKSLGNSPDPLNIIDKYGTDATRFTMIYLAPLGQDIRMEVDVEKQDVPSVEIGRNFANKVWNSGRFLMMKLEEALGENELNFDAIPDLKEEEMTTADKWILSKFNTTVQRMENALDKFKVTEYSKMMYDYIWSDFCAWYVEIIKVQFNNAENNEYKQSLMKFALGIYEGILKLLHPVMPFITEELWHILLSKSADESISLEKLPTVNAGEVSEKIENSFDLIKLVVEEIRKLRASVNIQPSQKVAVTFGIKEDELFNLFEGQKDSIATLAKCKEITLTKEDIQPEGVVASVVRGVNIFIHIGDAIDKDAEKKRLEKEIKRLEGNIFGTEKKLGNEKFVNNAKPEIVQREREKLESMKNSLQKVQENYKSLG